MIVRSFEQHFVFTTDFVMIHNGKNCVHILRRTKLMFGKKIHMPKLESEQNLDSVINEKSEDATVVPESHSSTYLDSEILQSSTGRIAILIQEILQIKNLTIEPILDFSNDLTVYPILSRIGESPENTLFLDDLVTDGILDKQLHEKITVCPLHPTTIFSSMRIYCPKCNSINLDKLHLFEHKKCGHILESKNLEFMTNENFICSFCSVKIEDKEKEIKALAMWYKCEKCSERFDDALIKLHCIKYNHDFEINAAKLKSTFSYRLKTLHVSTNSDSTQIKNELVKLLEGYHFLTTKNEFVKGKSGNIHEIPIVARGKSTDDLFLIFIKNQYDPVNISDMNSIVIPKLDIDPKNTLFVTPSGIEDGVENMAKHYGINVISDSDFSVILSQVEKFVADQYSNNSDQK